MAVRSSAVYGEAAGGVSGGFYFAFYFWFYFAFYFEPPANDAAITVSIAVNDTGLTR
jgi:hypothetical protein